jgi:hypothetical protein
MEPTIGGFIAFVQNVLQPPDVFDASTSVFVTYAYDFAVQWVTKQLKTVPGIPGASSVYAIAVYNLAADFLINIAQDQPGDPVVPNSGTGNNPNGLRYWAFLRSRYHIDSFVPGVIQTSSDEGTSVGYVVPDQFSQFSVADLQNLKTPFGRRYLGIAQSFGTVWGLS